MCTVHFKDNVRQICTSMCMCVMCLLVIINVFLKGIALSSVWTLPYMTGLVVGTLAEHICMEGVCVTVKICKMLFMF